MTQTLPVIGIVFKHYMRLLPASYIKLKDTIMCKV